MTGEMFDYPTRFRVDSESEGGESYLVDISMWPLGLNDKNVMIYNGSCGCGAGIGCKDFMYRCEPRLKKEENKGKVFRCKHIRYARDNALDYLIDSMKKHDPNQNEENST